MLKVILLKGLPGSGKTTWAINHQKLHPGEFIRINNDDLREMLDKRTSHFNRQKDSQKPISDPIIEDLLFKLTDLTILTALKLGKNIIIDNTNLNPFHEQHIKELTQGLAEFQIIDLTDLPLEEVMKRNETRSQPVEKEVIMLMHNKYLEDE